MVLKKSLAEIIIKKRLDLFSLPVLDQKRVKKEGAI